MDELRKILRDALPEAVGGLIAAGAIALVGLFGAIYATFGLGPAILAVLVAALAGYLFIRWLKIPAETIHPPPPPPPPAERRVPRPPHRRVETFIARHDEEGRDVVQRVTERLCHDCLVTIWGHGGVGKTTLALEVAHGMVPDLAGGVVWASADGRPGFDLPFLLDEVCTRLGREDARPFPLDRKSAVARTLLDERDCLLAVDNFETVADEQQKAIAAFLNDVPCPVLVTSRERLPRGENVRVGPMTPEEAREFLASLAGGSRLEKVDLTRVAEVAERNPLLMRWVVRQLEEAMRFEDVFDELARGRGEAAERIFGRSFELLDADGQAALLALSLFVPTASREALAAVCGFDLERARGAIRQLARLDLLATEDERLGVVGLTRRLAWAWLAKDERAGELVGRFISHFLAYAQAHAQPTPEDYDALEAERENLLAVMDYAYAAEDWQGVMRVRDAMDEFLDVRGYWDEHTRWGEQAMEAARQAKEQKAVARFAHNTAVVYQRRGDYEEARRLYGESLEIKEKLGAQSGIAISLHQLGMLAHDQGEYEEARRLYQESLEIAKKLGDQSGIAQTFHQLGMLAHAQGEYEEARRLYGESLEIKEKLGAQSGIAISLHQLGMLAHDQGEYEEARRLYQESLEIAKKLGAQSGIAQTFHQLGMLAQAQGEYEEARRLYGESLEIEKKLGDQAGIALSLAQTALLEETTGNLEEALRLIRQAEEIFRRLRVSEAEQARRDRERLEGGGGNTTSN